MLGRSSTDGTTRSLGFTVFRRRATIIARPTAGRTRCFALHDVVDLLRVDRFVLHERIGHHVELVTVVLEKLQCLRVAFINNAPHFLINRERRLV